MRSQETFKALADPTRRKILKALRKGSLTAGELSDKFPVTKGTLSHHFNVLKNAGLIRSRRAGQSVVYSLNTSVFEDAARMVIELFGDRPAEG